MEEDCRKGREKGDKIPQPATTTNCPLNNVGKREGRWVESTLEDEYEDTVLAAHIARNWRDGGKANGHHRN